MKTVRSILLSIVLCLPFLLCSCAVGIEKPTYTVLEKVGEFEIRQYNPYLIAETRVDADFKDAGNVAFRRLFRYISGENKAQESISMTAPVIQKADSEKISMTAPVTQQRSGQQYAVSFVMPSKYSLQTPAATLGPLRLSLMKSLLNALLLSGIQAPGAKSGMKQRKLLYRSS